MKRAKQQLKVIRLFLLASGIQSTAGSFKNRCGGQVTTAFKAATRSGNAFVAVPVPVIRIKTK